MIDINFIRNFPDLFNEKQSKRKSQIKSDDVIVLDTKLRALKTSLQELQAERNNISKSKDQSDALKTRAKEIKSRIQQVNDEIQEVEQKLNDILLTIPNIIADDVEYGESDLDNVEIRRYGEKREFDFTPKTHDDIAENLGLMNFKLPSIISGSRFTVLRSKLSRLERGLINYLLDIHTKEFGYEEISVPFLVKDIALYGTGQLPKFKDDLFKTTDDLWLIPTAEVYLTNLVREQILQEKELPLRFVAFTSCFRSEAGAAGRDTKGMIRQHQFGKVELVSITTKEQSQDEHERMTNAAETVLKRLGLHYRVVRLCSTDIGFSANKTYDIEVWMPGLNRFLEISSCSNCKDFQARRMKARVKRENGNELVHTLNGSGVAVGRLLCAVIENYQTNDGHVIIPDALRKYVDFDVI